jgi:hypothetical protein
LSACCIPLCRVAEGDVAFCGGEIVIRAALRLTFVAVLGALVGPVACTCSSSDDAPKPEASTAAADGLHDVRRACEHRAKWPLRLRRPCTQCVSLAAAPACGCKTDSKVYSALCAKEQRAKLDNKACEPVWQCTYKCKPTECDCIAACYEGKAACHKLASALDGCIAETCDNYCRPK